MCDIKKEVVKVVAKTACTVVLNACVPGSGCIIDLGEAAVDLYNGDIAGCVINVICGALSLVSFGITSSLKQAVKKPVKEFGIQSAKKMVKQGTKEIGSRATKEIAKGGSKEAIVQSAKTASKQVSKNVGKEFARDLAKGVLNESIEEGVRMAGKMSVPGMILNAAAKGTLLNEIPSMGIETLKHLTADSMEKCAEHLFKKEGMKSAFSAAMVKASCEAAGPTIKNDIAIKIAVSGVTNLIARNKRRD